MPETLKINRKTTPPTLTIRTVSTREIRLSPLRDLYEAQDRVKARGSHYFDEDTARYFRAKYHDSRGLSDGSILIVESTKRTGFGAPDARREYRVMRITLIGEILYFKGPGSLSGLDSESWLTCDGARRSMLKRKEAFEAASVKARKLPDIGGI